MMSPKRKRTVLSVIFVCGLFGGVFSVQAGEGFPSPADDYVNDFAGVISKADGERLRLKLENLEKQTGIEAVVVTIQSVQNHAADGKSLEAFATELFNDWGVGRKKENNGAMILVVVKDRKCRIELGGGYGSRYDTLMKQVIDEDMIPYFKTGDYSRGIAEGVNGVIGKITQEVSWFSFYKWQILLVVLIVVCVFAGYSCFQKGNKGWGWAFFSIAFVLLFFLIKALASGKAKSGFGGGRSFGGGAGGSW